MMMWLFPNLLPRRIGLPASWAIWGIKAEIHLSPNWVLPIVQGSTQNSFLSSNCLAQVSRNVFFCEFSATHTVDSSRFNNDHAYFSKSILHVRITYPARLNAFQGSRASWKRACGLWIQTDLDPLSLSRWGGPNVLRLGLLIRRKGKQQEFRGARSLFCQVVSSHPDSWGSAVAQSQQSRVRESLTAPSPTVDSLTSSVAMGEITGKHTVTTSSLSSQKLRLPPTHSCPNFLFLVISFPFINGLTWEDTPIL